jgi:predicted AlkP superfamily phosphohydrolase/phosphomutase
VTAARAARGGGALALAVFGTLAASAAHWGCATRTPAAPGRSLVVLGFDGMDYALTRRLMAEGRMPSFSRLAAAGSFAPLGTSIPPQSPVAWSEFITGLDAGGHGIFDFIHRDPNTMIPYLSTSRTEDPKRLLKLGRYQFPLEAGKVELLRRGRAFWEALEARGIRTSVIRMPANFPPSGTAHQELSGMGTPDIVGSYGIFSFFTSAPFTTERELSGGKIYPVDVVDGVVRARLYGPQNPFLQEKQKLSVELTAFLDPAEPLAKLVVGGEERLLQAGEWSDWVPVELPMVPTQKLRAEARFYLKQVRPDFELYVSPLNFDPLAPALPISTPAGLAAELAKAKGRFYTQGMPEDTKSLKTGTLAPEEFLAQARAAGRETIEQWDYFLERFEGGLLFYYFGNLDQVSHMMWRSMDPDHPAYDAKQDARFADVIPSLYVELDALVGRTLERLGKDTTLVVMSDHGFTSWRRSFHLNAWLRQNGFLAVRDPDLRRDPGLFENVDWPGTRAYGLGLNGLYLNLRGRERRGSVAAAEREALMEEIAARLLATIDPATGKAAVTKVYRRERDYRDRGSLEVGPDLVVGYAHGTRGADESALGEVTGEVIADNTSPWSGDHCMDHETVPGILLTSRPLKRPAPDLRSLAGALLAELGIEGFPARASGNEE